MQHTRVERNAIVREAIDNYATLSTISPKVETDDSGNVLGLTADNISQYPLAKKLGFQDGDVLQTINNERIDSREKLVEIFQRYQNEPSFRIGILRNGQPNILVFDVETVFLYPFAVAYNQLLFFGVVEVVLFVLILAAGLAYAWRAGALEWV